MALPEYTLKQLLEAGVHFGHQTHRWNPLMEEYIYGVRNGIHIIDLTQTFSLLDTALNAVHETISKGGSILFVGTKRQAQKPVADAAERSAQYYMNHRWLGGTLTNWKTVSNSISRLKKLDEQLSDGATGLTKKERLNLEREQTKLNASLGGIREMGGLPDLLFVIDSNKESLAIQEAKNLSIPVIAILDTNSDPTGIDFPIPGNDDAARSIGLYCDLVAKAALEGMTNQLTAAGIDLGESVESTDESTESSSSKRNETSENEMEESQSHKLDDKSDGEKVDDEKSTDSEGNPQNSSLTTVSKAKKPAEDEIPATEKKDEKPDINVVKEKKDNMKDPEPKSPERVATIDEAKKKKNSTDKAKSLKSNTASKSKKSVTDSSKQMKEKSKDSDSGSSEKADNSTKSSSVKTTKSDVTKKTSKSGDKKKSAVKESE